jgi:hypothetical protein
MVLRLSRSATEDIGSTPRSPLFTRCSSVKAGI